MQPNDSVISRIRLIGNFGYATKLKHHSLCFAIEGKAEKPMAINVAKGVDTIKKKLTSLWSTLRSRGEGVQI